jgi:hypothetical protein
MYSSINSLNFLCEGSKAFCKDFLDRNNIPTAFYGVFTEVELAVKYVKEKGVPIVIKAKLYMNVHWMVLYNLKVFCSDMKFKMAATAGLSLTLDPIGKMFL